MINVLLCLLHLLVLYNSHYIRLFFFSEIPGPTHRVFQGPPYDEEEYTEQYGSAEDTDQEEIPNTVQGVAGWGHTPTQGAPSRGTFHTVPHAVEPAVHSGCARPTSFVRALIHMLAILWPTPSRWRSCTLTCQSETFSYLFYICRLPEKQLLK